jgi:hypothetical protein
MAQQALIIGPKQQQQLEQQHDVTEAREKTPAVHV